MPGELTHDRFSACVHQTFRIGPETGGVEAELVEARKLGDGGPRRDPFSLLFRTAPNLVLPQKIYPVSHPQLGTVEIFLVPVGPDSTGMLHQAVFN
jgi:hypothetical protein